MALLYKQYGHNAPIINIWYVAGNWKTVKAMILLRNQKYPDFPALLHAKGLRTLTKYEDFYHYFKCNKHKHILTKP